MFFRVEFSSKTKSLLNSILKFKEELNSIHAQNKYLKKLTYFEKKIQSESQKALNINKAKINEINESINILKAEFDILYEIDFENSYHNFNSKSNIGYNSSNNHNLKNMRTNLKNNNQKCRMSFLMKDAINNNIILPSEFLGAIKERFRI